MANLKLLQHNKGSTMNMNKKILIMCAFIFTTTHIQSAQAEERKAIEAKIWRLLQQRESKTHILSQLEHQDHVINGIAGYNPDQVFSLMSTNDARGLNPVQMYFNQPGLGRDFIAWDNPYLIPHFGLNRRIECCNTWITSGERLLGTKKLPGAPELTELGKATIARQIASEKKIRYSLQRRKTWISLVAILNRKVFDR